MKIKSGKKLEKFGQEKLNEVKKNLRLLALDYDGTLYSHHDPKFEHKKAIELILKILRKFHVAVITARAASALKYITPLIQKNLPRKKSLKSFFLATGNGVILSELRDGRLIEIYNHALTIQDVEIIAKTYKEISKHLKIGRDELTQKALETFSKFIKDYWNEFIPKEFFSISKQFKGQLFAEPAKISIALPTNPTKRKQLINLLGKEFKNAITIVTGDIDFHIIKKLPKDGKIMAIETIMELFHLSQFQIAAFGDLPEGNDRELLINFPYSFTNAVDFCQKKADPESPPYLLSGALDSPIGCIHQAIEFLIQ